jgi:cytochrome c biogenesis protein CcmG, thiol:disulfide interchange protein DsbE
VNWRKPLIGPFSGLQLVSVVVAVLVTASILALLNAPIASTVQPSLPAPGASFVAVSDPVEGLRVGDVAPEFTGTINEETVQLTDLDGNPIHLSDLRGRPVWINFWASWCPPCQAETPTLRDVYAEHADDGLALVAISVQETTADDVRAYVERYALPYTVGFDATSAIFHAYHAYGLPTQLFLDRDGVIRNVVLGPIGRTQVEQILAPLLADPQSSLPGLSASPN